MISTLTKELLSKLKKKGFTMLVTEAQDDHSAIFTPTKWDIDGFNDDPGSYGYEDNEVMIIENAIMYMDDADMEQFKIKLDKQ